MDKGAAVRIIVATLKKQNFVETGPGALDFDGSISVHGSAVDIHISIPDPRFINKPTIHLKDRTQVPLETLAHIEEDTGVCYVSGAGLPIDIYEPGEAVLRILKAVEHTLESSYGGKALDEVEDEYQSYWQADLPVRCLIERASIADNFDCYCFFAYRNGDAQFLGLSKEKILNTYEVKKAQKAVIWNSSAPLGPSEGVMAPKTLSQLSEWLKAKQGLFDHSWEEALSLLCEEAYLFLHASNCFVGLRLQIPGHIANSVQRGSIRRSQLPRILMGHSDNIGLSRFSVTPASLVDVTGRNRATHKGLENTSIALVGCGTIGSHLARYLGQNGAGAASKFTLYDPEILSAGNIGRHLLDFDDVGRSKASSTAKKVQEFHPQLQIRSYDGDVFERMQELSKHDLVIDATGIWNIQNALNDWFMNAGEIKTRAMLHSWVFMNGVGVQSFLNLKDDFACFRCLKPKFDGPWRFPVGDEGEDLELRPATCGDGSYIPFTVDVSVIAAALANRAAVDWVNGNPGYRLRSAITDFDRGRYRKPCSPQPSTQCPACGGLRIKS